MISNDDADGYVERLKQYMEQPDVSERMEEAEIAFHVNTTILLTYACTNLLAGLRGNAFSASEAIRQACGYMSDMDEAETKVFILNLLAAVIGMEAKANHDGDLEAAIVGIIGPRAMLRVEGYIATNGDLCPFCGQATQATEGVDHVCEGIDEPE